MRGPRFHSWEEEAGDPRRAPRTADHQVPTLAKRPLIPIWLQKFFSPPLHPPTLSKGCHGLSRRPGSGRGHPRAVRRVGFLDAQGCGCRGRGVAIPAGD